MPGATGDKAKRLPTTSVTAWMSSRTVAGAPSSTTTQVKPGELRTARTTSPRMQIPNTLNSERPTSLTMNGYSNTPAS